MRSKMSYILILFGLLIFLACSSFFYTKIDKVSFEESDKELINPGRGFYIHVDSSEEADFEDFREENITIALLAYDIEDYLNIPIEEKKLDELEENLKNAQENGVQIIFRAAYGFHRNYTDPATLNQIYYHVEQIAPILNKYKDTILAVQAGFFGPWGEWHSSIYLKDESYAVDNRNKLLEVLLENLDEEIVINVRRPRFLRDAIECGLDENRLGLHNDALFADEKDMGTYDDSSYTREAELTWLKSNLRTGINGGESNQLSTYSDIHNAIKEMKMMSLTYLNSQYHEDVLNKWRKSEYEGENAFDYIANHLGYRFALDEIKVANSIKRNNEIKVDATIKNLGFAPIHEAYNIYLAVEKDGKTIFKPMEGDLSSLKGNEKKTFYANIEIPEGFLTNKDSNIRVGLYIGRNEPSNEINLLQVVELANEEVSYEEGVNFFYEIK